MSSHLLPRESKEVNFTSNVYLVLLSVCCQEICFCLASFGTLTGSSTLAAWEPVRTKTRVCASSNHAPSTKQQREKGQKDPYSDSPCAEKKSGRGCKDPFFPKLSKDLLQSNLSQSTDKTWHTLESKGQ